MNVLKLLDQLEDHIEGGSTIPFSGKVMIDREVITELLKEIRIQLPDEVKQAQWIKEERNKILVDAQNEADRIVHHTQERVSELAEQDELVKMAKDKADEIIEKAQLEADIMKRNSIDYVDDILESIQRNVSKIVDTIGSNREELSDMKEKLEA